jgi:hypothetical protein
VKSCDQSCDQPVTKEEWEAIATLRAASRVALRGDVLAIPSRVVAAIDTVNGILNRTRPSIIAGRDV